MVIIANPQSPIIKKLEGLHLFHFDGAPCAQRVRFALHEKGIKRGREIKFAADDPISTKSENDTWTSREVSLIRKDHLAPEYAKINPNLVVPALVHDGTLHLESMDIIEYLDEEFGGTPLVPRYDPELLANASSLTKLGKELHRSVRFVTFRWGLRGLARLSSKEESNLKTLMQNSNDNEQLVNFYKGYNSRSIPDDIYLAHLKKLNAAFAGHEERLQDGRLFLTSNNLTMADVIWAMKTQRLLECDYPFEQCFPTYYEWFRRVSSRPSFKEGVMGNYKFMSTAFKVKANLEHVLGIGLKREVLKHVA